MNIPKPIVLIGMMGVGKTSLGHLLAQSLNLQFIDIDRDIVEKENLSIPTIFRTLGEAYFREIELQTITESLQSKACVISTGGGAVTIPKTAKLIWQQSLSIWIHSDIDILIKRIGKDSNRPLFKNGNQEEILKKLVKERVPIYKKADIHIKSGDEPLEDTLKKIIKELNAFTNSLEKD